jgi:hypothetical protein
MHSLRLSILLLSIVNFKGEFFLFKKNVFLSPLRQRKIIESDIKGEKEEWEHCWTCQCGVNENQRVIAALSMLSNLCWVSHLISINGRKLLSLVSKCVFWALVGALIWMLLFYRRLRTRAGVKFLNHAFYLNWIGTEKAFDKTQVMKKAGFEGAATYKYLKVEF